MVDVQSLELPAVLAPDVLPALRALQRRDLAGAGRGARARRGNPAAVAPRGAARSRAVAAILATCWSWVAVAFLGHRYAKINFAATYFAWAFGLVAALLIVEGVLRGRLRFEWPADFAGKAGLWIFLFALAVEPLSAPLLGRGWRGIEIFGIAPDPTAVGTLGILLVAKGARRWPWTIVPAIWCAMTGATLLAMKAPDACVAPAAAVLAVSLAISRAFAIRRGGGD